MTRPRTRLSRTLVAMVAAATLVLAGVPASATTGSSLTVSGRVAIPPGEFSHLFDVRVFVLMDGGTWHLHRDLTVKGDGTFSESGFYPEDEYRFVLVSFSDTWTGGTYAGNGVPLVADPDDGAPVEAGASGLVIEPIRGADLHGTVAAPDDFFWHPSFSAELRLDPIGQDHITYHLPAVVVVDGSMGGKFTIPNVHPDARFRLNVRRAPARFVTGFYHAGATGPVADESHATPVQAGDPVHVRLAPEHGTPRLSAVLAPELSGSGYVGARLTATSGLWSLDDVVLSHQWLRDGKPIAGATSTSYTLVPADAGARVTVRVTATVPGFPAASSSAVPVAARFMAPRPTTAPSVTGTHRLGKTLRASAGSWSTSGLTFTYRWLRDGAPIGGATQRTYKLKSKDVGKRISVRVTARKAGYDDGASSSSAVKVKKTKASLKVTAKKVRASKRPKVVVRVKAAGYAKPAGTVRVKYGKKTVKAKLKASAKGKVTVRLPKLAKGRHKLTVRFTASSKTKKYLTKPKAKKVTLRVR